MSAREAWGRWSAGVRYCIVAICEYTVVGGAICGARALGQAKLQIDTSAATESDERDDGWWCPVVSVNADNVAAKSGDSGALEMDAIEAFSPTKSHSPG